MILKGKNIILTGAGRGIGRVIAQHCADEGANLALVARTQTDLEETLNLIVNTPGKHYIVKCDLSSSEDIKSCFNNITSRFKNIDVLINNAGIQNPIGPFYKNDMEVWKSNIRVNLFGTAELTHHVLKKMVPRKKGKIINISGGGATTPRPNFSAYSVSKTAIVRFTETLAEELKELNITVNSLAPGAVNTKMLDELVASGNNAGKELADALIRQTKGGTDPAIVSRLIVFLISDEGDGISGKLISAPWDLWEDSNFQLVLKSDKDFGTLRRIDNKYFIRKS